MKELPMPYVRASQSPILTAPRLPIGYFKNGADFVLRETPHSSINVTLNPTNFSLGVVMDGKPIKALTVEDYYPCSDTLDDILMFLGTRSEIREKVFITRTTRQEITQSHAMARELLEKNYADAREVDRSTVLSDIVEEIVMQHHHGMNKIPGEVSVTFRRRVIEDRFQNEEYTVSAKRERLLTMFDDINRQHIYAGLG